MKACSIPLSTYRLQFNRSFTFLQAADLVPYLAELGITHCYASPYLRSRPGSMHGYDIIDHHHLDPEIGTPEDYERFVVALHQHGMGQILDVVPNHMGILSADNTWWLEVLENGEASTYADFFDIDWYPLKDELQGKVLVPVLGDQYGTVLDRGELKLTFDTEKGEFSIFYFQHRFPVNPREYPRILGYGLEALHEQLGAENENLLELQSLISAFNHLPGREEAAPEKRAERLRDKEIHKRRLAALCARSPEIKEFIEHSVQKINGTAGDSSPSTHCMSSSRRRRTDWLIGEWLRMTSTIAGSSMSTISRGCGRKTKLYSRKRTNLFCSCCNKARLMDCG